MDRAEKVCDRISEILTKEPEVKDASTFAGYSLLDDQLKARAGTLFVSLKDSTKGTAPKIALSR